MPAPLLAVDAPSLLYRAFYALPDSIKGADGKPVNALLGAANLILREVEQHDPRAVVLCFGPDAADYRVELYPAYHADRPPVPDDAGAAVGRARGLLRRLRLDGRRPRLARGRRPARLLRPARGRGRWPGAAPDRRPRHVPVRRRRGHRALREDRHRGVPSRSAPDEVERRYGIAPGAGPGLHRPARRPLRRHPRGKGGRREDRRRPAPPARLARGGAREGARRARGRSCARRCSTPATSCSPSSEIATLRDAGVKRPRRRADRLRGRRGGGARSAGMNRLGERLEKLAG